MTESSFLKATTHFEHLQKSIYVREPSCMFRQGSQDFLSHQLYDFMLVNLSEPHLYNGKNKTYLIQWS